jgi:cellulose synthase/poly-beta-1,6-N-acetylglucosamine synthase-like glycosyltransferase
LSLHTFLLGFFELCIALSVIGLVSVASGFLALIGIKIYDLLGPPHWRNSLPRAFVPEADLPHVLVQIPVFNEHEVAIGAMRCAAALDWPKDRLHIQILDDSTDESVAMVAEAAIRLRDDGYLVEHRWRRDRTGFKAGALAEGLAGTKVPLIAMLDVDFRPPSHWLRDIVPILLADPDAAFVQSRCEFSNYRTNWLTRVQGMMLDAHFVIEQAARFRGGWLFQFNGTGGIWRRDAIAEAGGWSSDSIVEDLDLTVRVGLAGWHGLFLMEPGIPGLVPDRIAHWRVQQRRWSTGFVEVARKLVPTIWHAPWSFAYKMSAMFLIFVQLFYPCAAVGFVSLFVCIALRHGNYAPYLPWLILISTLIVVIISGMTLLPYIALKRGSLWNYLSTVVMVAPAMLFLSLSNAPSILSTAVGRSEGFKRTPKSTKAKDEHAGVS